MDTTTQKRHRYKDEGESDDGSSTQKKHKALDDELLNDDILGFLSLDDETVAELTRLLDSEKPEPVTFKARFIDDPYSSPVVCQSSSSYITINGNEESCGSSFSESDSSVMVNVDLGGVNTWKKHMGFDFFGMECGGGEWGSSDEGVVGVKEYEGGRTDRCDCFGWDDDDIALARFIGEDIL